MVLLLFSFCWLLCYFFFFFFQAEDGIRDRTVTGVQTCALPISFDLTEIEVRGERRRVALPQAAVQLERGSRERRLEALRQVRLEDVAGVHVLDDARDGVQVPGAREV